MARTAFGDPKAVTRTYSQAKTEDDEINRRLNVDFENAEKRMTLQDARQYVGDDYEKAIEKTYRK